MRAETYSVRMESTRLACGGILVLKRQCENVLHGIKHIDVSRYYLETIPG